VPSLRKRSGDKQSLKQRAGFHHYFQELAFSGNGFSRPNSTTTCNCACGGRAIANYGGGIG